MLCDAARRAPQIQRLLAGSTHRLPPGVELRGNNAPRPTTPTSFLHRVEGLSVGIDLCDLDTPIAGSRTEGIGFGPGITVVLGKFSEEYLGWAVGVDCGTLRVVDKYSH